jgi:hypothetical protein
VGATLGQQLFAIINSTVVTPYPVFQPPCQGPLYVGLIEELNKNLPPEWPSVSDLRTDVYPQPGLYVLNTVSSIVSNLPQPNLPSGCQPTDWLDVRTQILTELDYLQDLYDFQIAFQVGTLAVAEAMTSSFDTAVNTINNNSSNGSMAILGILSDIVEMAEVFQAASAVSTILGSYLAILSSIPGSSGVTGQLDQLQTQLKLMIDNANTAAGDVYAPICADWGKLQDFIQLLPSLEGLQHDRQSLRDQRLPGGSALDHGDCLLPRRELGLLRRPVEHQSSPRRDPGSDRARTIQRGPLLPPDRCPAERFGREHDRHLLPISRMERTELLVVRPVRSIGLLELHQRDSANRIQRSDGHGLDDRWPQLRHGLASSHARPILFKRRDSCTRGGIDPMGDHSARQPPRLLRHRDRVCQSRWRLGIRFFAEQLLDAHAGKIELVFRRAAHAVDVSRNDNRWSRLPRPGAYVFEQQLVDRRRGRDL